MAVPVPSELLQQTYGPTPAEARLTALLVRGSPRRRRPSA